MKVGRARVKLANLVPCHPQLGCVFELQQVLYERMAAEAQIQQEGVRFLGAAPQAVVLPFSEHAFGELREKRGGLSGVGESGRLWNDLAESSAHRCVVAGVQDLGGVGIHHGGNRG